MKPRYLIALSLLLLVALAPPAPAQTPVEGAPKLIDYQGTALDSNGNPLAPSTPTNYTMKFRLYTTQSGGSPLWSESQTVTVSNGQFSVRLGQGIIIGAEPRPSLETVFAGKDRYLGLTIVVPPQAEAEITPRLAFLSSPFSFIAERAKTADSVSQSAGTSSLGITSISNLTIAGPTKVNANNVMEFGGGVSGKEVNAGKIGYGTFDANTLDITGAGSAPNGTDRKVKIYSEGGLTVVGPLSVSGALTLGGGLSLSGALSVSADETIQPPFSLNFGSTTRQMLNLYGTSFGIGIQNNTLYSRANTNFAWFSGGVHNDNQNNPGAGGTLLAALNPGGFTLNSGSISVPSGNLSVSGSLTGSNLSINTGLQLAAALSGNNGTGTWLGLANTSAGGRAWNLISSGAGNTGGAGKLLVSDGGNPVHAFTNANLGVGTVNPSDRLTVQTAGTGGGGAEAIRIQDNGGRYVRMYRSDNGFCISGNAMSQAGGGNATIQWDGDSNWDNLSDGTLKRDIADAEPVLGRLMDLQVRRYRWKDGPADEKAHFGVIAQEVQPIFPDLISSMPHQSEQKMTVKYGAFGLIAAKAVQELKKEKDDEISALREENEKLRARLTTLEANDKARDAKLAAIELLLPTVRTVAQKTNAAGN